MHSPLSKITLLESCKNAMSPQLKASYFALQALGKALEIQLKIVMIIIDSLKKIFALLAQATHFYCWKL